MPRPVVSAAQLAAEWQERHAGPEEAAHFRTTNPQRVGASSQGSVSEGARSPAQESAWQAMYSRFEADEAANDRLFEYHKSLHSQGDDNVTVEQFGPMGNVSTTSQRMAEIERASKAPIDDGLERRMAHKYDGRRLQSYHSPEHPEAPREPEGNTSAAERKEFLERAGANPYDTYHNRDGHVLGRPGVELLKERSPEMQHFMQTIKFQTSAMGPMATPLRHGLDSGEDTYAAIRAKHPPLLQPAKGVSNVAIALSDWDWGDRREAVATSEMYRHGPNIVAALTIAAFLVVYNLQLQYDTWHYYEEYLGLDIRRVDDLEKYMLMIFSVIIVRLIFTHPSAIVAVLLIRLNRMRRGKPIGPP